MKEQPKERSSVEALRLLIEDLELNHEYCPQEVILKAAAELRRLHAENEELRRTVRLIVKAVRREEETND